MSQRVNNWIGIFILPILNKYTTHSVHSFFSPMLLLVILTTIIPSHVVPQENLFYTGKNYGSEANYNPIALILNGSYDILQLEKQNRHIFNLPYATGFNNVFRNLSSPLKQISTYGWKDFLLDEVIPLRFDKKNAQWWPTTNYTLLAEA